MASFLRLRFGFSICSGFGRLPGEVWKDTEGIETVRHFAANVANLVKKLHPEITN